MTAVSFAALPPSLSLASVPPTSGNAVPARAAVAAAKAAEPDSAKPTPGTSTPAPTTTLSKTELANAVRALQAKMDKLNPALAFVVDHSSGRALIQLTDRSTKEVIQQFPTEAAMQISKALDRFQKGQLLNTSV